MMPSAGLLAFLITFTSFNSMQAKHFLVETKDNAEAGKRRFILGTLPFPSRNPSLKYLLSDLVSQCGPFTRYDQLGPFFVVSVLLVLVFNKFFFQPKSNAHITSISFQPNAPEKMNLAPSSDLRDPSKAVILEGKVEKQ